MQCSFLDSHLGGWGENTVIMKVPRKMKWVMICRLYRAKWHGNHSFEREKTRCIEEKAVHWLLGVIESRHQHDQSLYISYWIGNYDKTKAWLFEGWFIFDTMQKQKMDHYLLNTLRTKNPSITEDFSHFCQWKTLAVIILIRLIKEVLKFDWPFSWSSLSFPLGLDSCSPLFGLPAS